MSLSKTGIPYGDVSWNPIVGCTGNTPACTGCWISAIQSATTRQRRYPVSSTCKGCKYLESKLETAGCEITLLCNRLDDSAGPHGLVLGDAEDGLPQRCRHYDDSPETREWRW